MVEYANVAAYKMYCISMANLQEQIVKTNGTDPAKDQVLYEIRIEYYRVCCYEKDGYKLIPIEGIHNKSFFCWLYHYSVKPKASEIH